MKLSFLAAAFAGLLAACTSAAPAPAAATDPATSPGTIEVMVLGMYHMGNPGQDLANAKIDPVTTPEKQAQLQAVADALAKFQPTAIAVERIAKDQATMLDHRYPEFKPADLLTNPDERVQVGYRLAHQLGLARVYAVDEQDHDGELSYFPFELVQDWSARNGRTADLDALVAVGQSQMAELEVRQKTETVGQLLTDFNRPADVAKGHGFYTQLFSYGAGADQPGAVLNGRWYTRNAVIFAKLRQAAKPGDRIIMLYGAGHGYWLRQLASTTPGFKLVEAIDYLPH